MLRRKVDDPDSKRWSGRGIFCYAPGPKSTAATAGALALLGALLGVAGAYVVVVATYLDDVGYLSRLPTLDLLLMIVGVPWAAIAAGWLLSGREPPAIARPAIE